MGLTKTQKWWIGSVILGGITLVGIYLNRQFNKLKSAEWIFGGAKNIKLGIDRIRFTVLYNVHNEGDISVVMYGQDYDVFVNGTFVAKVKNETDVKIKSNRVSQIPFNVDFSLKDLIKAGLFNFSDILTNKEKVDIVIKGFLNLKIGILTISRQPFELKFNLAEITNNQ